VQRRFRRLREPQEIRQAWRVRFGQFLSGRGPDVDHPDVEAKRQAGQRMIAVEHCHALCDIGDREDLPGRPGDLTFDAHADRDAFTEVVDRQQGDEVGVVVAECIFGFQLQRQPIAGHFSHQRCLETRQDVVVTRQVDQRLIGLFEQVALRVVQRHVETDQRTLVDLHRHRLRGIMRRDAFL
jgi:hypothetical protein